MIDGTLEEDVNHFEALLIARALVNDSVTAQQEELGLTHLGLSKILAGTTLPTAKTLTI